MANPTFTGQQGEDKLYQFEQIDVGAIGSGTPGLAVVQASPFAQTVQDTVSAAGTTQAGATVLSNNAVAWNCTVVGANSGVLLPKSYAGAEVAVNNNQGVNALLIYPNGTETINALSASAGFSAAANTITILYCFTAGKWFTK